MARGKDIIPAVAEFDRLYESVESMPWADIENAAGVTFDRNARQVIYDCTIEFSASFALQEKGAEATRFKEIVECISDVAHRALALSQRVNRPNARDYHLGKEAADAEVFDAVSLAYSSDGILRQAVDDMARAAESAMMCLGGVPTLSTEASAVQPLTAGIAGFVLEALKGAEPRRARGSKPWPGVVAHEFLRWGLHIGPQSSRFLRFICVVLGRRIGERSLKTAFDLLRERVPPEHPHFSVLRK